SGGDQACRQEGALERVRRLTGQEHLLDFRHECRRVNHVRIWRQVKQSRERLRIPLEAGGESEIAHQPVHQQHRGFETIAVFKAIGHGILDPVAYLLAGWVTVAKCVWLSERLTAAQARFKKPCIPAAAL